MTESPGHEEMITLACIEDCLVGGVATAAPLGLRWCNRALLLDKAGVLFLFACDNRGG